MGALRGVSSGGENCYFPVFINTLVHTKVPSTSALLPSAGESAEEAARYASIEAFVAIGY